MFSEDDRRWMERALALAGRGAGRTSPNPLVGAVVVRNGVCVGAGFHPMAGEPHAEVYALNEAHELAEGATLYVTLEPCCHQGRTPPCTDLILRRKIRRVVSAMDDPDSRVAGQGHDQLRGAGVFAESGLLSEQARRLNAPYLKWKRTGTPFVTLKLATSLDGKIATRTGESKWITSDAARLDGHRLRDTHDAIVVGVGTVLADNPSLTTRLPHGGRDPLRVVLDTEARTPLSARILHLDSSAKTVVAVAQDAETARKAALENAGADIVELPRCPSGIDISRLLQILGARNILSVLVEGGAKVNGSFVDAGYVDRVVAYVAPRLIGGVDAPGSVGGVGFERLADALRLEDVRVSLLGEDVRIEGDRKTSPFEDITVRNGSVP